MSEIRSIKEILASIDVLNERLKHQKSEVVEAKKKINVCGYGKRYLNRMQSNVDFTQYQINSLQKALDRRKKYGRKGK